MSAKTRTLADHSLFPTIVFEVYGVNAILDLVGEGFGYAFLTQTAVTNLASNREFHLSSIVGESLEAKLSLAMNSHHQITATPCALIDVVRRAVIDRLGQSANRP